MQPPRSVASFFIMRVWGRLSLCPLLRYNILGSGRWCKEMVVKRKHFSSFDTDSPGFNPSGRSKILAPTGEYDLLNAIASGDRRRRRLATDTPFGSADVPHHAAQMANTRLVHLSLLDVFSAPQAVCNTGIVCTIGEF